MFYVLCPLLFSTVDCQSINLPLLRSAPPITQRRNQRKDVLCSFLGPKISSLLCLKICSRLRWDTSTWLNSAVHTESSESFFFSNVKLNQQVFQHLAKLDFFAVSHRLCLFCIVFGVRCHRSVWWAGRDRLRANITTTLSIRWWWEWESSKSKSDWL